jgi:hypothetical protein
MTKKKKPVLRPFHETCLEGIRQTHDCLLAANRKVDDFVFLTRLRIELRPILALLEMTEIPENKIGEVIDRLTAFRTNFLVRLRKIPFSCKEEVDRILKYFESAIDSLNSRLI